MMMRQWRNIVGLRSRFHPTRPLCSIPQIIPIHRRAAHIGVGDQPGLVFHVKHHSCRCDGSPVAAASGSEPRPSLTLNGPLARRRGHPGTSTRSSYRRSRLIRLGVSRETSSPHTPPLLALSAIHTITSHHAPHHAPLRRGHRVGLDGHTCRAWRLPFPWARCGLRSAWSFHHIPHRVRLRARRRVGLNGRARRAWLLPFPSARCDSRSTPPLHHAPHRARLPAGFRSHAHAGPSDCCFHVPTVIRTQGAPSWAIYRKDDALTYAPRPVTWVVTRVRVPPSKPPSSRRLTTAKPHSARRAQRWHVELLRAVPRSVPPRPPLTPPCTAACADACADTPRAPICASALLSVAGNPPMTPPMVAVVRFSPPRLPFARDGASCHASMPPTPTDHRSDFAESMRDAAGRTRELRRPGNVRHRIPEQEQN